MGRKGLEYTYSRSFAWKSRPRDWASFHITFRDRSLHGKVHKELLCYLFLTSTSTLFLFSPFLTPNVFLVIKRNVFFYLCWYKNIWAYIIWLHILSICSYIETQLVSPKLSSWLKSLSFVIWERCCSEAVRFCKRNFLLSIFHFFSAPSFVSSPYFPNS